MPVEKVVEVPVYNDREVEVDIITESIVENRINIDKDKMVELVKTVDKPVYNKRINEIFVDKVVERRVEVPVEKYVEVPVVTELEQHIDVET